MLLNELFEARDPRQSAIDAALAALHRRVSSKGDRQSLHGYAFDIVKSFRLGLDARQLAKLYKQRYNIDEAFDTEAEWVLDDYTKKHSSGNIQIFATKVDDAYIELMYKRSFDGEVTIAFSRNGSTGVTGEGNQNKIFGAVINHVKQWVNKYQPQRIIFSAFKPNTGAFGSQDTTRSGLYRRMLQRFAAQNGYEFEVQNEKNQDTFVLTKQNRSV